MATLLFLSHLVWTISFSLLRGPLLTVHLYHGLVSLLSVEPCSLGNYSQINKLALIQLCSRTPPCVPHLPKSSMRRNQFLAYSPSFCCSMLEGSHGSLSSLTRHRMLPSRLCCDLTLVILTRKQGQVPKKEHVLLQEKGLCSIFRQGGSAHVEQGKANCCC